MGLSLRARFIFGRLVKLPYPITAAKLANMCGGLIGRNEGLAKALSDLEAVGLVKHTSRGWLALEPTGEMRERFEWPKRLAHLRRWQDKYAYTPIPLPVSNPFRKTNPKNSLELYCLWRAGEVIDGPPCVSLLSTKLGITRKTVAKLIGHIRTMKGAYNEDGIVELSCPIQTAELAVDPINQYLEDVGVSEGNRDKLREQQAALKLSDTKFMKLVKKAVLKHNPTTYGDDPSGIINSFLKRVPEFKR